jgi:hypothetical protein
VALPLHAYSFVSLALAACDSRLVSRNVHLSHQPLRWRYRYVTVILSHLRWWVSRVCDGEAPSHTSLAVALTKVKKKGREWKDALFDKVRSYCEKHEAVYVLKYYNMRNDRFKELREVRCRSVAPVAPTLTPLSRGVCIESHQCVCRRCGNLQYSCWRPRRNCRPH